MQRNTSPRKTPASASACSVAQVVLGIGTSHSPLLVLGAGDWALRSQDDRRNRALNTLDGRLMSYDPLAAERGEPYAAESDPATFPALVQRAEQAPYPLAQAITGWP